MTTSEAADAPTPDFEPRPTTTAFAVVEEVAETIAAVESLHAGPTAGPELERAAREAAAEVRAAEAEADEG